MTLLRDISKEDKIISIIGMAKNAGKTTALNFLIEEADDEELTLGVTSTGRDGEVTDLVTGTDKPKVYLYSGTMVTIPSKLFDLCGAGLEILRMTGCTTALGEILICRVAESGYVQVAGPVNIRDQKKVCTKMLELGAEMVLVDGAADRRAAAEPGASDAVILSTGAVLSRSLSKVIEETVHILNLYRLPRLEEGKVRDLLEKRGAEERILIGNGRDVRTLSLKTGLTAGNLLDDEIKEETEWIYLPGALTQGIISSIHPRKLRGLRLILKDPTRIFIKAGPWQQILRKGLSVSVMNNIRVAALTVNPYSPEGYSFNRGELLDAVKEAAEGIPVVDVRAGGL